MALKNTKITREIFQTCNKLLSNKSDIAPSHKASELAENLQENIYQNFRYDVSNTSKCSFLPKVDIHLKESKQIAVFGMQTLQPAKYPKYIQVNINARDEGDRKLHKRSDSRKFDIQYPLLKAIAEPQKGAHESAQLKKNLVVNGTTNIIRSRNYTTSPFILVSRGYSKKAKEEKCEKPKQKCPKGPCPEFSLKNCQKSKGSDCLHEYTDPKCTKKFAPYPSYSETCAQQLEDDPSECFQCPWSRCGGIEDIKPPKRKYHTSTRPHNMAMIPAHVEYMLYKGCCAKKKPCQAPPPKCGEEKKKKKDDCPGVKRKPKKCDSTWTNAYRLWCAKETIIPPLTILENVKTVAKGTDVRGKFPFDERQADYEYLKKKPCASETTCKKPKYKRVPEGCKSDKCQNCMSNMAEIIIYELNKCPSEKTKCPRKEKQKCPDVDKSTDINKIIAKKHDKGHPPPCPEKKDESQPCKEKPRKLPYKRERDMFDAYYRKNPRPYPPEAEH